MARLIIVDPRRVIRQVNLSGPITTIGRDTVNRIAIAGDRVSRRHAVIEWVDHEYVLTDLGSLNGTFLNDERTRVRSHVLHNGDAIRIGEHQLRFLCRVRQATMATEALRLLTIPADLRQLGKLGGTQANNRPAFG